MPASEFRQPRTHRMVRWGWLPGCHVTLGPKIKAVRAGMFVGCVFFRFFTDRRGGDHINPILIGSSYAVAHVPSVSDTGVWWTGIHHNMSEAVQEAAVQRVEDCCFFSRCFDSFVHRFFPDLCLLVNMKNSSAFYDINSLHTADICNWVRTCICATVIWPFCQQFFVSVKSTVRENSTTPGSSF